MKIKGEYKIELRDAKTGKLTDERVGHNFVTDFWKELFKNMGYLRPNAFANRESLIVDDLFGGIMCFDSAITETTDMAGKHNHPIYAPASKSMIANGSMAINTNKAPTELGQFNSSESIASNGFSRRFVYDWDTNEGNGTIGCVCLSSKYGGYIGVGNSTSGTYDSSISCYQPLERALNTGDNQVQTAISSGSSKIAYLDFSRNVIGVVQSLNFTSGELVIAEYDASATRLNPFKELNTVVASRKINEITYNFTPITDTVRGWVCYCHYGYWGIVTWDWTNQSDNKVNVLRFNTDGTQGQYRFVGFQLGYASSQDYEPAYTFSFCFLDNYFISAAIQSSYNGAYAYVRAGNISTGTNTLLGNIYRRVNAGTTADAILVLEDRVYLENYTIRMKNGSLTLEQTNGAAMIPAMFSSGGTVGGFQAIDNPYVIFGVGNNNNVYTMVVSGTLLRPYLATIANLSSPVTKTADKTMKITYTLTLVED